MAAKKPKIKADPAKQLNLWGSGTSEDALEAGIRTRMFQPVYLPGPQPYEEGLSAPHYLRPLSKEEYLKRTARPKTPVSKPDTRFRVDETGSSGFEKPPKISKEDQTAHDKTVALKTRDDQIKQIMSELEAAASGQSLKSEVAGVNKKDKKNWFERNIGGKIADVTNALGRQAIGNVTGHIFDYWSRPEQAVMGAYSYAQERNLLNLNPLTSNTSTVNPANIPKEKWDKMDDQQRATAVHNYEEAQKVIKEGPLARAKKGFTTKNAGYSPADNFLRQIDQAYNYKAPTAAKVGGVAAAFGAEANMDPTNLITFDVVRRGISAVKDAGKVRDAVEVVSGAKDAALGVKAGSTAEKILQGTAAANTGRARVAAANVPGGPVGRTVPTDVGAYQKKVDDLARQIETSQGRVGPEFTRLLTEQHATAVANLEAAKAANPTTRIAGELPRFSGSTVDETRKAAAQISLLEGQVEKARAEYEALRVGGEEKSRLYKEYQRKNAILEEKLNEWDTLYNDWDTPAQTSHMGIPEHEQVFSDDFTKRQAIEYAQNTPPADIPFNIQDLEDQLFLYGENPDLMPADFDPAAVQRELNAWREAHDINLQRSLSHGIAGEEIDQLQEETQRLLDESVRKKGAHAAPGMSKAAADKKQAIWDLNKQIDEIYHQHGRNIENLGDAPGTLGGKGFEFGGEAQSAKRAAELAQEAEQGARITDASEKGFKKLQADTRKAAKAVALHEEAAKDVLRKGGVLPEGNEAALAAKKAAHEALLERVKKAEGIRETAKSLPVGGKLSLLEKRLEKLRKLSEKAPLNKELAAKLAKTKAQVEAARVAAIPDNAQHVLNVVDKLTKGAKNITLEEIQAVVASSPTVQDQLVALAKSIEAEPVGAFGAEVGAKAPKISVDELPSTRLMQAINKATEDAATTAASKATLSQAAKIVQDGTASAEARKIAMDILNDSGMFGRPLTKAGIRSKVAQEMFKLIEDDAVKEAAVRRTGEKLNELKQAGEKLIPSSRKEDMFQESLLEEVLPVASSLQKILEEGGIGKRFAIRFAKKDLGEFKPIGAILRSAYVPFELVGKIGNTGPGKTFAKAFKIGAHFPDETNYIRQMAENSGTVAHKQWVKEVTADFTNTLSHEEERQIAKAIEGGYELEQPHLEELRQLAIQKSQKIFQAQTDIGKYMPVQQQDGYLYHYYHTRNKKLIEDFKEGRLADMKAGLKGPTLATAKAQGLKPEERIDKILIMQHRDFIRDLQRSNFRQQVMHYFGVMTDNPAMANGLGLKEVVGDNMNKMFQDEAKMKNAKWYLAPEIHETFEAMDKLMGIGHNPDADNFLHAFDSLVRAYKTSATIGNIGNWTNNTVGDFFMNWVDNVRNPQWYTKATRAVYGDAKESEKVVNYGIGGHAFDRQRLLDTFRTIAPSGGFIRTEGGRGFTKWGTKGAAGIPSRATRWVQNTYEAREETVRFAHFMGAMDEEIRPLLARGMSLDKAYDAAAELAAKRVSKWNIDYTAITPFERMLRKRFIPFYTFMRKATPLMLEAMITRPGKVVHYNMAQRSIEKMLGLPRIEDDGTTWPEWTMEQGITRFQADNVDEPYYLRDPSPFNVINRLLGGDSYRSPLRNIMNQSSPLIKAPFELQSGKTLYNDRPIDRWGDWLLNQVPTASIIARGLGHPLSPQSTSVSTSGSGAGSSILERLGVLGIPIGRNTEARQQAALHEKIGKNSDIIQRINDAINPAGFKMTHQTDTSHGDYYTVRAPDGSVFGRFRDPVEALKAIQPSLAG